MAVGMSRISLEYCIGVPVYPSARVRSLARIVRLDRLSGRTGARSCLENGPEKSPSLSRQSRVRTPHSRSASAIDRLFVNATSPLAAIGHLSRDPPTRDFQPEIRERFLSVRGGEISRKIVKNVRGSSERFGGGSRGQMVRPSATRAFLSVSRLIVYAYPLARAVSAASRRSPRRPCETEEGRERDGAREHGSTKRSMGDGETPASSQSSWLVRLGVLVRSVRALADCLDQTR